MPTTVHRPLTDADIVTLQSLLDAVPAPLEPLDASSVDGFLCALLVQPKTVPVSRWLPYVTDIDGRPLPARFDAGALHALVKQRHAELETAIAKRQWFDPWIFELEADDDSEAAIDDAVLPWVAGFAAAFDRFPALAERADPARLNEPLALLYRHLDADDLEDADDLLAEIEQLEPAADLDEAVEDLVRATLLLADLAHPPAARAARPVRRR